MTSAVPCDQVLEHPQWLVEVQAPVRHLDRGRQRLLAVAPTSVGRRVAVGAGVASGGRQAGGGDRDHLVAQSAVQFPPHPRWSLPHSCGT